MEHIATTKEHIISEAKKLFTSLGFAGVSMSMIAKEVGITKAALYHFFENKASIYITVIEDVMLAIGEVFDAALILDTADNPLSDIIEHIISVAMHEGNIMLRMDKCPVFEEKERMQIVFQTFFQKVEGVMNHYDIQDARLATHVFLNAIHGYIRWAHMDPEATNVRVYSEYLAGLFQKNTYHTL